MPTNQLSPSTRGWLRFLHRKATTPDDLELCRPSGVLVG